MAKKDFREILGTCLTLQSRGKTAGFTLIELLVAALIGSLVISGLLFLVVELLNTDKKEKALTQTQEDLSVALDYIKADLEQGVYVYEGECLGTQKRDDDTNTKDKNEYCPGLSNFINFSSGGVTPILAFWKLDEVPYTSGDDLPANCNIFSTDKDKKTCKTLKLTRNTYTLVVYSLRKLSDGTWDGPAQITRYALRQYTTLSTLQQNQGWKNPMDSDTSFQSWPNKPNGEANEYSKPNSYLDEVLVDLADYGTDPEKSWQPCPNDYSRTPPDALNTANNTSFYACVKKPTMGSQGIEGQDVFIFLRGNALKRAGLSGRNSTYLPKLQAQVKTRSVFNFTPPDLGNN